ncbi:DUF1559 domain-containing protein [Aeoliella sp.]|uniref:DUF1559 family PulG-like putative transporter n=1 Tax=Aeoliella sp. TaxID=2795800 RepID=UPI003CCC3128
MTRTTPCNCSRKRAFTLVELLVVIAIIGILVALLLPAVQAAREAARRSACTNNQKQLALACINFESTNKALPYGRKVDWWDSYTWTQEILPYIEQQTVYDNYHDITATNTNGGHNGWSPAGDDALKRSARHTQIPPYYCPSDGTPTQNEMGSANWGLWRGNYRASVGSENNLYGETDQTLTLFRRDNNVNKTVFGPGCFQVKRNASPVDSSTQRFTDEPYRIRLRQITDGTSSTILLSEGLSATEVVDWGGVMGSLIYGNMGGGLMSTLYGPNESSVPDQLLGPCPVDQGDSRYPEETAPCRGSGHPGERSGGGSQTWAVARSYHPGGVLAAKADGSVTFFTDDVDVAYWRSLGTRNAGDIVSAE